MNECVLIGKLTDFRELYDSLRRTELERVFELFCVRFKARKSAANAAKNPVAEVAGGGGAEKEGAGGSGKAKKERSPSK